MKDENNTSTSSLPKYIIKNITKDKIEIKGRIIYPGDEFTVFNLAPYKRMIANNFLVSELAEKPLKDTPEEENLLIYKPTETPSAKENIKETINLKNDEHEYEQIHTNDESSYIQKKVLNPSEKEEITNSLFRFYIDKKIDKQDLINVKKFYSSIGITSLIDDETKQLIEHANSYEELVAVLLNNVYPYFFKQKVR